MPVAGARARRAADASPARGAIPHAAALPPTRPRRGETARCLLAGAMILLCALPFALRPADESLPATRRLVPDTGTEGLAQGGDGIDTFDRAQAVADGAGIGGDSGACVGTKTE